MSDTLDKITDMVLSATGGGCVGSLFGPVGTVTGAIIGGAGPELLKVVANRLQHSTHSHTDKK